MSTEQLAALLQECRPLINAWPQCRDDLVPRIDAALHAAGVAAALREANRSAHGEYPAGRLNEQDAGALAMAIGVEAGKVVIRFPKPVLWFGMPPDQAIGLAGLLVKHARQGAL